VEGGAHSNEKWALDLFSGTQSVAKKLREMGYQVVTLDKVSRTKPDIAIDVMEWNFQEAYQPGFFDLVAASVPCNEYSQAKKVGVRKMDQADEVVKRTLEIIKYLKPKKWWIENPKNGYLKTRQILDPYPYVDLDYCQFCDWGYQKPTRFWGSPNVVNRESRVCDFRTCPNLVDGPFGKKRHKYKLGGLQMKFSTRMKGRIPEAVVEYLLDEKGLKGVPLGREPQGSVVGGEPNMWETPECEILLDPCLLRPRKSYILNTCTTRSDKVQLVMEIPAVLPNGETKNLRILIDTGAQANLVRTGLIPRHLFYGAPRVLKLITASGQRMEGGERVVDVNLEFSMEKNGHQQEEKVQFPTTFYEAAIKMDAILSYPWMEQRKIGVFPHKRALIAELPDPTYLYGIGGNKDVDRKPSSSGRGRGVGVWNNRWYRRTVTSHPGNGEGGGGVLLTSSQPAGRWRLAHPRPQGEGEEGYDPTQNLPIGEGKMDSRWVDEKKKSMSKREKEKFRKKMAQILSPEWEKWGLRLPTDKEGNPGALLDAVEISYVEEKMVPGNSTKRHIHELIVVSEKEFEETEEIELLREQIKKDYADTVFREGLPKEQPIRGPYGLAYIPLKDNAVPQSQKPYTMKGEKEVAYRKIVQDWIEAGFIERPRKSGIEWSSTGFPVPKKSATFPWRGVVDVRGPNSQTRKCNYPLPLIDQMLIKHGGCHIFSKIDLKQAFHQQPLHEDSRPITCTHTPFGIFQWKVNVMGLKNAPVQFQQMMDDILSPVKDVCDAYIDDIIVGTRVKEGENLIVAHTRDLRRVLDLLKSWELVADLKKCFFFVPQVEFCGHIMGGGKRHPAPGTLSAIERWEPPKNISELRAYLGFTNYYGVYIQDYSKLVASLQEKLKVPHEIGKKGSKVPIKWDENDQKAFEEIKKAMLTVGVAAHQPRSTFCPKSGR